MSITSNQFKSTTIYGNFYNLDNSVNSIPASASFQRDLTIGGQLSVNGVSFSSKVDNSSNNIALTLKSDKTYVDTALALKSDKTYVDTALALKSDKTYVDTALALKLNITDLSYSTNTITTINNNLTINGDLDISRNLHVNNVLQTSPLHYNDTTPITNLSYLPTNPFVGSLTNILTFNINTNNSIFTLNINTPLSNQESGTLGASVSTTSNRINSISLFLYQNNTLLQTITASYTLTGTYNTYTPTGSNVGYSYQQFLGMVSGSFVINTTTLNNNGTDLFSIRMTITSQRLNVISGSSFGYIVNTNVSGKSNTGPITINQTRTGYVSPAYTTINQSLIYSTDTSGSITCNEILSNTLYNQGVIDTGSINCNTKIYTSQLFATTDITTTSLTAVGFIQSVRTITIQNVYLPETPLVNIYLMGFNSGMNVYLSNAIEDYIGSIYYIRKIPPLLTSNNIFFIPASGCKLYDNLTVYTSSINFTETNYTLLYGGNGVWYFLNKST